MKANRVRLSELAFEKEREIDLARLSSKAPEGMSLEPNMDSSDSVVKPTTRMLMEIEKRGQEKKEADQNTALRYYHCTLILFSLLGFRKWTRKLKSWNGR